MATKDPSHRRVRHVEAIAARAPDHDATELEILRALAESAGIDEAAPRLLRALATYLDADVAALWTISSDGQRAKRAAIHRTRGGSGDDDDGDLHLGERGIAAWPTRAQWAPPGTTDPVVTALVGARATRDLAIAVHPVTRDEQPLGWLLLAGRDLSEPGGDAPGLLAYTARLLARAIEHGRAEEVHRRHTEAALFHSEERLRYVTMAIRDAIYDWDVVRNRIWCNEAYHLMFAPGPPGDDAQGWWLASVHDDDRERVMQSIVAAFRTRSSSWSSEYRLRRADGAYAPILDRGYVLYDREGQPMRMIGTITDVGRRSLGDALRDGQSRVLEVIALDAPLDEVLNTLCRVIEAQSEGLSCSVLLLDDDGVHVRHVAAPSLPAGYVRALDGAHIGPKRGSCGTAMYWNRTVIVTDVLNDPLWDDHRDMALDHGFRACWSIPIVSHEGRVLGSFAMYYNQPRSPTAVELELIELAARLGSIALERHRAGVQLRASLQEKVVLLKEIHHRVKNNLQIINSLLALQAEKLTDPDVVEIFAESQNRVRAMAMVHESLYRSGDLARVRFAAHVDGLCAHLMRSYDASSRVQCDLQIADVRLDLERAIPCGLIINELVSNALKHAFPDGRDGRIQVRLEALPASAYALTVSDDGVGLADGIDPSRGDTLGLQLVTDLSQQLGGTVALERVGGTTVTVRFADVRKEARA